MTTSPEKGTPVFIDFGDGVERECHIVRPGPAGSWLIRSPEGAEGYYSGLFRRKPWLQAEARRAAERSATVPAHAKPRVVPPKTCPVCDGRKVWMDEPCECVLPPGVTEGGAA